MVWITHGEGNGKPLQYSCLENPMDRGAWWAAVHGVAKSQTRLSNFTFSFTFFLWITQFYFKWNSLRRKFWIQIITTAIFSPLFHVSPFCNWNKKEGECHCYALIMLLVWGKEKSLPKTLSYVQHIDGFDSTGKTLVWFLLHLLLSVWGSDISTWASVASSVKWSHQSHNLTGT